MIGIDTNVLVRYLTLDDEDPGPGDFSDYLIAERNRRAGARTTMTFDRKLLGSALFEGI